MLELKFFNISAFYIFVALAFILPKIPVIGKFFNMINTLIHELGHALMAIPFDGSVKKIELFKDTSGATTISCKNKTGSFIVSISGYLFAAIFSYFSFYLIHVGYQKGFLFMITLIAIFTLILWVRNSYGVIWIILFSAINGYIIYLNDPYYINLLTLLYATFIAVESLSSSFIILYLSLTNKQQAGDATILAKQTKIPAFVWGLLFAAFSTYMGLLILIQFFDYQILKFWN